MAKRVDLVGQRFGRITVIKPTTKEDLINAGLATDRRRWWGQCDCGNLKIYTTGNLKSGTTSSCGCYKTEYLENELKIGDKYGSLIITKKTSKKLRRITVYEFYCEACNSYCEMSREAITKGSQTCGCSKYVDLRGMIFGKLTVLKRSENKQQRNFKWVCKCECGNIVEVAGGKLTSGGTRSCGCLFKERMSGENNPNWNPNLTEDEREKQRSIQSGEHRKWRKQVFERDDYTCQYCGQRGGNLHAHHLDGYNWCIERRFDLTNGVTLCEECHRDFHKKYGYKNNTEQQFKEFMRG